MDMTTGWFQLKHDVRAGMRGVAEGLFAFGEGYCLASEDAAGRDKSLEAVVFGHEDAALCGYYAGRFMRVLTYPVAYAIGQKWGGAIQTKAEQRSECIRQLLQGVNPQAIDCFMLNRESAIMVDALQEKDTKEVVDVYCQRRTEQQNDMALFQSFMKETGIRIAGGAVGFGLLLWGLNAMFVSPENRMPKSKSEIDEAYVPQKKAGKDSSSVLRVVFD